MRSFVNVPESETDFQQRFHDLVAQWRRETIFLSSTTAIALHPAYQEIIKMGDRALPLIFQELIETPGHWFSALHAITGEDPACAEDSFSGAVGAWLRWGQEHGYTP